MVQPKSVRDVLTRALYMTPQPDVVRFLQAEVQNFLAQHMTIAKQKMDRISTLEEAQQILTDFWNSVSGEGGVQ
jgi:hypothetical protein